MIDRDPIEPRSQVRLHLAHKVAGIFAKVGQLARILGRDDDAEMMPIILTPIGKRTIIGAVRLGVEHARR